MIRMTMIFLSYCGIHLLFANSLSGASPGIEVLDSGICLKGGGAEYHFDKGNFFLLDRVTYQNRPVFVKNLGLTYLMHNGKWYSDKTPYPDYAPGDYSCKIKKEGETVCLTVSAEGQRAKLRRTFTLRGDDPALEVSVRFEIRGENNIEWSNLVGTPVPPETFQIRLVTTVENGMAVSRIRCIQSPFLDKNGEFVKLGNFTGREWRNQPLVGSYDPESDRGALFLIQPEKSQWLFRCGQTASRKEKYIGIAPDHFSAGDGCGFLFAEFRILPFSGNPEALQENVAAPLIKKLKKYHLIADLYETGGRIRNGNDFALWQELPDQKVFRDSNVPRTAADTVTLYAAKGESESFQLVLQARNRDMEKVTLEILPLVSGKKQIPPERITWSGIGYAPAVIPWNSATELLTEHPDILSGPFPVSCRQGSAQPFLIIVNVPDTAWPGIYEGKIRIRNQEELLAEVPLKLRVWSFSIAERTLTAALDFWPRNRKYPPEKRNAVQAAVENMVVAHRGGGRWVANPRVKWNPDGTLAEVDFAPFDASVEKFIRKYRHNVIVSRFFMLGYGRIPRRNFFGTAEEILSPLWKRKVLEFAKILSAHLKDKKWKDRICFDLFDEPKNEYASMINETVALLHTVEPSWRFTLAGSYNPLYKDGIRYWNVPMITCTPGLIDMIRKAGGEITVYNPPGYEYNQSLTLARGNYWWLWKNRISYIYQWVVNCWAEHGYRGWDDYRCASWIVPGPDGPLSTLRLNATRDGIEDYEYLTLLRSVLPEVCNRDPVLADRGKNLLKRASGVAWSTPCEEIAVVVTQNPALLHVLHKEIGEWLDEITRRMPELFPRRE